MAEPGPDQSDVDRFILVHIESVPHLEALLLVWSSRPKKWTVEELSQRLYVRPEVVKEVVHDLVQKQLLVLGPDPAQQYGYVSESEERDRVIQAVEETYRRELVRISNLIHSKPSVAVREFARAFRFTKERE